MICVPGRIVEVAGDARPLLGGRQPALALSLALGAHGTLLELGQPFAPQPRAIAGEPRPGPDRGPEEKLRSKLALDEVRPEQRGDAGRKDEPPRA